MTGGISRQEALLRLPAQYALALRLRDAGIAPEDISEYVDVPLGALDVHLRLAELKLRVAQGYVIVG